MKIDADFIQKLLINRRFYLPSNYLKRIDKKKITPKRHKFIFPKIIGYSFCGLYKDINTGNITLEYKPGRNELYTKFYHYITGKYNVIVDSDGKKLLNYYEAGRRLLNTSTKSATIPSSRFITTAFKELEPTYYCYHTEMGKRTDRKLPLMTEEQFRLLKKAYKKLASTAPPKYEQKLQEELLKLKAVWRYYAV